MKRAIQNKTSDINYIDGADHTYDGREVELANEINNFLEKINKI